MTQAQLQGGSLSGTTLLATLYDRLDQGGYAGFIIHKTDPHRSEYGEKRDNFVHYLTNFSGSVGFVAVSARAQKSAIFVDGRYTLQAQNEVDPELFDQENFTLKDIERWFAPGGVGGFQGGDIIAYDPLLLSKAEHDQLVQRLQKYDLILQAVDHNPLAALWEARAPLAIPAVIPYPLEYAGVSFSQKLKVVRDLMAAQSVDGFFINLSESIAWLFNIRAPERSGTPAAPLYAYVPISGTCLLFAHAFQKTAALVEHFGKEVKIESYDDTFTLMARESVGKTIALDGSSATLKMISVVTSQGGIIHIGDDFCSYPRACKNSTEQAGMRQCHIRDGVAVSQLLAWLEGAMATEILTELDVVAKLLSFRKANDLFQGGSFDTISGSGPNGAIVHYSVDENSNRTLQKEDIFLMDSGGQYLDGTTDITRTVSLNQAPTAEQKDRFTRVLKGHIAIATARFPQGTTGAQLDALARSPLWKIGCDYAHGTGHGVGSYLGVHEGPQGISPRANKAPLMPGMVVSNEPGYYKEGAYGIRIENLVLVKRVPKSEGVEDRNMLCFETITLVPFDPSLVDQTLLNSAEKTWLSDYHKRIYETLSPLVDESTKSWLQRAVAAWS